MDRPMTTTASHFDSAGQRRIAAGLGMWVFLASEVMFFGPLFAGYVYGRLHFPAGFADASRHTEVALATVNTVLLMTGSLLMALASEAAEAGEQRLAARLLWGVAGIGVAFVCIKGVEYRLEWVEHLWPFASTFRFPVAAHAHAARYFYVLYFTMTGLHAVHLTVGIVAIATLAWRGGDDNRYHVTGLYWHFVDVVWLFLYPLIYLNGRSGP